MNFFESVKQAVTAKQAAEAYGLEVDKHGMAICPFHEDHHPSLMLDERYYCFGCHATGDVIDFAVRLFGISPKSAALKLAQDGERYAVSEWRLLGREGLLPEPPAGCL